jgi:hypothetical protein
MARRRTQKNGVHIFRNVGNLAVNGLEKGVGAAGNVLTRATKGVRNIGVGAVRVSGKVLRIGTGAANGVLGVPGRILSRRTRGRAGKKRATRRR